jgi:hypothetical protein
VKNNKSRGNSTAKIEGKKPIKKPWSDSPWLKIPFYLMVTLKEAGLSIKLFNSIKLLKFLNLIIVNIFPTSL